MSDSTSPDVLVEDMWNAIPERIREEFLSRRVASTTWGAYGSQDCDSRSWEPLRPVVLRGQAYQHLESIVARLLVLAVQACRRRAATLGELHQVLRFPLDLPLMDPDRPLVASELTQYARPDILIEKGRPRILEINVSTTLGGATVTPQLAEDFVQLCPQSGLRPPPSVVTARSAALVRTLAGNAGRNTPPRLLVPAYSAVDETGRRRGRKKPKPLIVPDAQRVGFEVIQADLAELRLDTDGRLLAADVPIDVVLLRLPGSGAYVVDDGGGLAAIRAADQAGTVTVFPRTESYLLSSKAVLGWLHEDCDTGLLALPDRDLVRDYVPRTVCLGLNGNSPDGSPHPAIGDRDRLITKPAVGNSGTGVRFGRHTAEQIWLSATAGAARQAPMVVQRRVVPDRITMPFLDRNTGRTVTTQVPFVLSPFMVDGKGASVGVRHMGPDAPVEDVVISVSHGARSNTVVLTDQ